MRTRAVEVTHWAAIGLGFSIPISAVLNNILLVVFLFAWLASQNFANKLKVIRAHPVGIAALLFAGVMAVGTLWAPEPLHQLRHSTSDIIRFALLAAFLTVFRDVSTRDRAIRAFLAASALVLVVSFILWSGIVEAIPGIKGSPNYPVVFKYHITHSFLMAFATVLFTLRAMGSGTGKTMRLFYGVLAGAAAFNILFMIPGRTGQVVLALAAFYIGISRFHWRGLAVVVGCAATIVTIAWFLPNSVMHQRAAIAWQEASAWRPGEVAPKDSSVGLRLEFYQNTLKMVAERPLLGAGTGSFATIYADQVAGTDMVATNHPHNSFLQLGAELGLLGLASLAWLLFVQWRSAGMLPETSERLAARSLLLFYVAAGLVSAPFTDHAEGIFFAWASGVWWAHAIDPASV